jgi:hypothetical protein
MIQPPENYFFLSYSRHDDDDKRFVAQFLLREGINIWVDNEKLIPGTPLWIKEIEHAIIGASAIVVLLSPIANESQWVLKEIRFAEEHGKIIFPVLIRGSEASSIPIDLVNHKIIDIRYERDTGLNQLITGLNQYLITRQEIERRIVIEQTKRDNERKKGSDEAENELQNVNYDKPIAEASHEKPPSSFKHVLKRIAEWYTGIIFCYLLLVLLMTVPADTSPSIYLPKQAIFGFVIGVLIGLYQRNLLKSHRLFANIWFVINSILFSAIWVPGWIVFLTNNSIYTSSVASVVEQSNNIIVAWVILNCLVSPWIFLKIFIEEKR